MSIMVVSCGLQKLLVSCFLLSPCLLVLKSGEKPIMIALDLKQNEKQDLFERGKERDGDNKITDAENE